MFDTDPTGWSLTTWWLYFLATYYVVGFFVFWSRFAWAERRAKQGHAADIRRYNLLLRGFPNAVYAKMFGKKRYEAPKP